MIYFITCCSRLVGSTEPEALICWSSLQIYQVQLIIMIIISKYICIYSNQSIYLEGSIEIECNIRVFL